jgi:uncharacterized protein (DUF2147 family)
MKYGVGSKRLSEDGQIYGNDRRSFDMTIRRLSSLLLVLVTTCLGATGVQATDKASPIGLWKGEDATFEMFESDGKLSARIVALTDPKTNDGKEKTDIHNPEATKRSHLIIGLVFICGLARKSDTRWEDGTIYDPHDGKTYSCAMDLQGHDQIKVRGFVGVILLGRNYVWTRVN